MLLILARCIPCSGVGLVHEDCITKMRLLSLVDLGSNESARIPYALIKDTLRVKKKKLSFYMLFFCVLFFDLGVICASDQ